MVSVDKGLTKFLPKDFRLETFSFSPKNKQTGLGPVVIKVTEPYFKAQKLQDKHSINICYLTDQSAFNWTIVTYYLVFYILKTVLQAKSLGSEYFIGYLKSPQKN